METRLLIAYLLIAALLFAGALMLRHLHRNHEEHRRIMRGYRPNRSRGREVSPR